MVQLYPVTSITMIIFARITIVQSAGSQAIAMALIYGKYRLTGSSGLVVVSTCPQCLRNATTTRKVHMVSEPCCCVMCVWEESIHSTLITLTWMVLLHGTTPSMGKSERHLTMKKLYWQILLALPFCHDTLFFTERMVNTGLLNDNSLQ